MGQAVGGGTVLWERDARGVADRHLQSSRGEQRLQRRPDPGTARGDGRARRAGRTAGRRPARQRQALPGRRRSQVGRRGRRGSRRTRTSGSRAPPPRRVRRLDTLPVPTVALVQGGCFGGGTGIVAACDVVVASEDALFSISETRWGLMAGIILPQLCQAMGLRQVRRYALTAERFDAHEARRLGLVHEVCATGALDETGARIVDALLMNAPGATTATKLRALQVGGRLRRRRGLCATWCASTPPPGSAPRRRRASPRSRRSADPPGIRAETSVDASTTIGHLSCYSITGNLSG